LEELALLILNRDGVIFGEHHVLLAMGVDEEGKKHLLGIAESASENPAVAKSLREDLVRPGRKTERKYLLVIDGSKALRAAMDAVFGGENPLQRCRQHKLENGMGCLLEHLKEQTKAALDPLAR
jgi:putative transposase